MKLQIKLQVGAKTREHLLEFPSTADLSKGAPGNIQFLLDNQPAQVDWAEISPGVYSILTGGRSFEVHVRTSPPTSPHCLACYSLTVGPRHYLAEVQDPRHKPYTGVALSAGGPQDILAPMPGKIVKMLVADGQQVTGGQGLLVIEAMKMQNELRAPRAGRVEKIYVREGTGVESGFKLLRLV